MQTQIPGDVVSVTHEVLLDLAFRLGQRRETATVFNVMTEAKRVLRPESQVEERMILRTWQQLIHAGAIVPGYDLTFPDFPHYHVVKIPL